MNKYETLETKQEIANYFIQGVTTNTKIFNDQTHIPNASFLTLDDRAHSITSFLSRPVDIMNVKWATSAVPNTELIPDGIEFPDVFLKFKPYFEKVKNFVGIRGNIVVRIKVNPQKFQAGLLYAYFLPNTDILSQKINMIQASLSGKTGCPGGTMINCEGGTFYDIEIPYVSQFNFYNLLSDQGNYGKFFLTPILPLKSADSEDYVDVQIQAFWKNPQPMFATGVAPLLVPTQMEQQMLHDNTLETGGSTHISNASLIDTLQNGIKPSTVLQTGVNLLQLAGYQKPNIETGICQSHLQTNKFMANYNGEQFSHSLALSSTNKLEHVAKPTSTAEDEMCLNNILQKSCYYKKFTFKTSDKNKDIIMNDEVYPAKIVPSGTAGIYNTTFVGYGSAPFSMWTGSMVYKFVCAKTQFHSGSLRVTWVPGLYDEDFAGTVITKADFDRNMCYSETYDLREMNQFDFVVPYTAATPALLNINPYSLAAKNIKKPNWCAGSIMVEVFTELRAPETVVQEMDIAVFVAAGSDIQVMGTSVPVFFPYSAIVPTQGIIDEEDQFRNQEAQEIDVPITGSLKNSYLASALLTGECIGSVKNLLARQALYANVTGGTTSVVRVSPFDFQSPVTTVNANIINFDYIDFFSYLYGWYAGGVNLSMFEPSQTPSNYYEARMLPSNNGFYPSSFERATNLDSSSATTFDSTLGLLPYPTQIIRSSLEGMSHLMVPYYNRVQITPCMTANQTANLVEEGSYPAPIVYLKGSANISNLRVFRSATDSFQFYYLLGPPQVTMLNNTAVSPAFILPDLLMTQQNQSVVTSGLTNTVSPFFQLANQVFNEITPVNVTPTTQFLSRTKKLATDSWSLTVCPAKLRYSFAIKSNDMHITSDFANFNAWNLVNGQLELFLKDVGTRPIFTTLVEDSTSVSRPIRMSTISSQNAVLTTTTATIPGVNGGSSFTFKTNVKTTSNILVMAPGRIPFIIPTGAVVSFNIDHPTAVQVIYLSNIYFLISSFLDDTKYINGNVCTPYVLNTPL